MKRILVSVLVLIVSLLCNISIVHAILIGEEIIGPEEVAIGDSIQLKSEYFVSNDMPFEGAKMGELERKDVTAKTTWTSSDPEIASISKTGKVIGKKAGVTTIRASYDEGNYTSVTNHGIVVTDKNKDSVKNEKSNSINISTFLIYSLLLLSVLLLLVIILLIIIIIIKNRKEK